MGKAKLVGCESIVCLVQLSTISVFYKQRNNFFFPVTSYALPTVLLRVPLSVVTGIIFTALTYFVVGFAPDAGRCASVLLQVCLSGMRYFIFAIGSAPGAYRCHSVGPFASPSQRGDWHSLSSANLCAICFARDAGMRTIHE